MRLKADSYFLLFLVLLGLVGMIMSLTFEYFQSIFLPLLMSSIIFVLALVELIKGTRSRHNPEAVAETRPPDTPEDKPGDKNDSAVQWQRFWNAFFWIVGFAAGIFLLGFLVSMPIFVLFYFKAQRRTWFSSVFLALVIAAAMYFLFEIGLKSPLYKGVLSAYLF